MSNNKTISVANVVVEVSTPYEAGSVINENEARALNQLRLENIRNNKRKEVKAMLEEADGDATKIQSKVQALISKYDETYEFSAVSSASKVDPLTKETRSIARDYLMSRLKEQGMTKKGYEEKNGEGAFEAKLLEIAEVESIVNLAKEALAKKAEMAANTSSISI